MPLEFPLTWRFSPPDTPSTRLVPPDAVEELYSLATKIAGFSNVGLREGLETFKKNLKIAAGEQYSASSSESWAASDLRLAFEGLQSQPPLLIEAVIDAGRSLTDKRGARLLDDAAPVNAILKKHGVGYRISGNRLELADGSQIDQTAAPTLLEQTNAELVAAWTRAEQLLLAGQTREAVAAIWGVVESVLLVFRGQKVGDKTVEGTYFNKVASSLRKSLRSAPDSNPLFAQTLSIAEQLQSYLSDPDSGGVRHGFDPSSAPKPPHEARLLIDFSKALARYICAEYERLGK